MAYVTCIFAILIAFVFPIFAYFFFAKKFNGTGKTFMLGVWTFLVFQIFTRIPLLNFLNTQAFFVVLPVTAPVLYALIMSSSAALFEEGGRFITMKLFMKKQNSALHGLSFAIGHGGIEAIMFVGLNAILILLGGIIQSGSVGALDMFFAGFERISAMMIHIGCTFLVLYATRTKNFWFVVFAFLAHTFVNFVSTLFQMNKSPLFVTELVVLAFGLAMLYVAFVIFKKIKAVDDKYVAENIAININ